MRRGAAASNDQPPSDQRVWNGDRDALLRFYLFAELCSRCGAMSFDAIRWAWSVSDRCPTPTALLVLLAVANAVNTMDKNSCFPSQDELARQARMSARTVREMLKSLQSVELLVREKRAHTSDLITLAFNPAVGAADPGEVCRSDRRSFPPNQESNQEENQAPPKGPPPGSDSFDEASPAPKRNKPRATKLALVVDNVEVQSPERWAFDEWNTMATRSGLPTAEKFTDDRQKKIRARLKEGGLDRWKEAVVRVECSSFCRGRNDRQWVATLDFLLQASSYQKVLDGNFRKDLQPGQDYDPGTQPSRGQLETSSTLRSLHRAFAAGGDQDF